METVIFFVTPWHSMVPLASIGKYKIIVFYNDLDRSFYVIVDSPKQAAALVNSYRSMYRVAVQFNRAEQINTEFRETMIDYLTT